MNNLGLLSYAPVSQYLDVLRNDIYQDEKEKKVLEKVKKKIEKV